MVPSSPCPSVLCFLWPVDMPGGRIAPMERDLGGGPLSMFIRVFGGQANCRRYSVLIRLRALLSEFPPGAFW